MTSPTNIAVSKLDTAERQLVVAAASAILKKQYIDREAGQKMADTLLAHEKSGEYDGVTDGAAFANLLTRQMREISADRHLTLDYSPDPFPPFPAEPTSEERARYAERMKQQNCTFEKVETLPIISAI